MKKLQTIFFTAFILTATTAHAGKWLAAGENLIFNLENYSSISPIVTVEYTGTNECKSGIRLNPAIQFDNQKVTLARGKCAQSEKDQTVYSQIYKAASKSFEDIREFLDDDDTFYQLK